MGFIESYKYLEKLCGEVLSDERRISAYIDEMINTPYGSHIVDGWNNDLKQLKHYRWIRNQISHEPGCTEENMCNPGDTEWINNFYSRIMNQTDPLALYAKATKARRVNNQSGTYGQEIYVDSTSKIYNIYHDKSSKSTYSTGFAICIIGLMVSVAVIIAVFAIDMFF